jgi:hypothetical protein
MSFSYAAEMRSLFILPALAFSLVAAPADLMKSLTLHASFDKSPDADFAVGDRRLFNAPNMNQPRTGSPGLPASGVVAQVPGGKFGSALKFVKKSPEMVFFYAEKNVEYAADKFQGTVSLWLNLAPDEDLEPGYTDPIQITPRAWNDAAFFVEFTKDEKPREFRLGAYADFKIWNPNNRDWNQIPFEEKPLVKVVNPPFKRGQWTHIVFTFANYNSGKADGQTHLYLNGEPRGQLSARNQLFTWDITKTRVMLGLSYVGLYDELSIFKRPLSAAEVKELYQLPNGMTALIK